MQRTSEVMFAQPILLRWSSFGNPGIGAEVSGLTTLQPPGRATFHYDLSNGFTGLQ